MSQLFSIVLTAALTLFGGIVLLVTGEVIKRFIIEPIYELSRITGKIHNILILYADVISNPGLDSKEHLREVQLLLRRRAAQLLDRNSAVPWYGFWQTLRFVPKRDDLEFASMLLIGLSNSLYQSEDNQGRKNDENRIKVLKLIRRASRVK